MSADVVVSRLLALLIGRTPWFLTPFQFGTRILMGAVCGAADAIAIGAAFAVVLAS